jgi:hypothetical protein
LENFHKRIGSWFKVNCEGITRQFSSQLSRIHATGEHNSPHGKAVVDRVWKESMTNVANLKKGSMSRTVQTRFFWMLPGLIATHAEEQSKLLIHSCISRLYNEKRSILNRTETPRTLVHRQNKGEPTAVEKTLALRRERAMKLEIPKAKDVTPKQLAQSHEECFLIFDEFDAKQV